MVCVATKREGALGEIDLVDVVEHDLGVEALGVLEEALHQIGPHDAIDVGGPVVDIGRGHQLAALGDAGDQHRLQVGAGGIERCRVAGRSRAEDQNAGMLGGSSHGLEGWSVGTRRASLTWGCNPLASTLVMATIAQTGPA